MPRRARLRDLGVGEADVAALVAQLRDGAGRVAHPRLANPDDARRILHAAV